MESGFEDIKELFRETDRKMQEADRKMRIMSAETDRRMRETDKKLKEMGKQIGGLGGRLGDFVEWTIKPGLVRVLKEQGISVNRTMRDLEAGRDGLAAQIDLLALNDTDAVVVEVKSKLEPRDVDEHLARLDKFKQIWPRWSDCRVLGAIAAMVLPSDAVRYAERKGLFVIGAKGDDATILNSPDFSPREW